MNKFLDLSVISLAIGAGVVVSILHNPLSASLVLLGVLSIWELIQKISLHDEEHATNKQ